MSTNPNPTGTAGKIDMTPYCGDDYPREGCSLTVDVRRDGYHLRVFAPNGALLESYAFAKSPRGIGRMVEEWCAGFAPRTQARLD